MDEEQQTQILYFSAPYNCAELSKFRLWVKNVEKDLKEAGYKVLYKSFNKKSDELEVHVLGKGDTTSHKANRKTLCAVKLVYK